MKPRCAEGNIEELSIQITSPRRLGRWLELFAVVVHQVEVLVTLHQRHSLSAKNQKFPVRFCNSRPLPNQYTHSSQSRVRHQPHHFGLLVHRSFIDLRAGVGDSKASSRMENREVCYSSSWVVAYDPFSLLNLLPVHLLKRNHSHLSCVTCPEKSSCPGTFLCNS